MKIKKKLVDILFVSPALLALIIVVIIPFAIGVYYSFTDWTGAGSPENFIGLDNYKDALQSDPQFIYSIVITIVFAAVNLVVLNVVAFSLAMLVTRKLKLTSFYRASFFIPNLIGGIILGYLWKFIYKIVLIEIGAMLGVEFLQTVMLENPNTALLAISITWTWQYAGYIMMIYVTAILNVPNDLIEASQIDGANMWQRLWHIMVPMLAPAFTITTFLVLINAFKQFDLVYALTAGGPARLLESSTSVVMSTELLAVNIYNEAAFARIPSDYAVAQAKAVLFFVALAIISVIQVTYNKRREVEV